MSPHCLRNNNLLRCYKYMLLLFLQCLHQQDYLCRCWCSSKEIFLQRATHRRCLVFVRMVLQQSSHQQLLESFDPGAIGFGFLTHWMV